MPQQTAKSLSALQREMILELGDRGSGGNFEPDVMSKLFTMGLIEVRSTDRRLALTDFGKLVYDELRRPN
jgi:hypothetical protein